MSKYSISKIKRYVAMILGTVFCLAAGVPAAEAAPDTAPYVVDNGGAPIAVSAFKAETELRTGLKADILHASEDSALSTGQILSLRDADGALIERREIAVMGDVTSTGQADLRQLVAIARAVTGELELKGAAFTAADFDKSGAIDLTDLSEASSRIRQNLAYETPQLRPVIRKLYLLSPDDHILVPLWFSDSAPDIPLVSTGTMEALLNYVCRITDTCGTTLSNPEPRIAELTRSNGSTARLDFAKKTISFDNFSRFMLPSFAVTEADVVSTSGVTADGETWYFERLPSSMERVGIPVAAELNSYNIPMYWSGQTGFIPLQTFSDLFLSPSRLQVLYNGKAACIISGGELGELADLYYSAPTGDRSPELAGFTCNELCMALDMYYGLSEQHDIADFRSFLHQTGLYEKVRSTDPVTANRALSELAFAYLGDLHTRVSYPSFYAGQDANVSSPIQSASVRDYMAWRTRFTDAVNNAYPEGIPGYEEIGDTAFVTVQTLNWNNVNYYNAPVGADTSDTMGLIAYAHSQIMRENSPVKNVVLDLSCSAGGAMDAAVYLLAWFGGSAQISINDTLTHGQSSTIYRADVNMDGRFTEDDTVASLNRYCLISPMSFSGGNLVPAMLKSDPRVTLLGQKSYGGACIVMPLTAADGTILQISGPRRLSRLVNGSYYDIDKGVFPDVQIAYPEDFYNRPELAKRIRSLVK